MTDTPTHRRHLLQAKMQEVVEWTRLLQTQRAQLVERIVRIKTHSKIARAIQVDTAIERILNRIGRDLSHTEERLNKAVDNINKARGLFLELSDYEVVLEPMEHTHGNTRNVGDTDVQGVVGHETTMSKPEPSST